MPLQMKPLLKALLKISLLLLMASPALADCKSDFAALIDKGLAAKSYEMTMTGSSAGQQMNITARVTLPDRFHVKMPDMEVIMIPQGIWMIEGGKWMQLPTEMTEMMKPMLDQVTRSPQEKLDKVENLECLGPKIVDGVTFDSYSFISSDEFAGIRSQVKVTAFADPSTGLISRMEIDGGPQGIVVQTIRHDDTIEIKPPK